MEKQIKITSRPPIVVVLGHVDHGKTSLLDAIRSSNVVGREAGGITQSIGASKITFTAADGKDKNIVFIDTPGHAAFSAMRSRGAKVADIAVLVVAADDGVAPQTKEALIAIREAKIPLIVVVTKIDLPTASVDTIYGQLEKENVLFEGRGGDTPLIQVSSKTKEGLDKLLELISLMAEINPIPANPQNPLEAVVIETTKDKRGMVASVVVRDGTLKTGEAYFYSGTKFKVRGLFNELGKLVKEAYPADAAIVLGFETLPGVGQVITSQESENQNQSNSQRVNFTIVEGQVGVIIKSGNLGSLEAILASLPEGIVVTASSVGEVLESDVLSARNLGAKYIFAFESKVSDSVIKLAEAEGVGVENFKIIYELLDKMKAIIASGVVKILGEAKVVASFPFDGKKVAGCKVVSGIISKTGNLSLVRDGKTLGQIKALSIRKQRLEVSDAKNMEEFGILFNPQLDFQIGDVIVSTRT